MSMATTFKALGKVALNLLKIAPKAAKAGVKIAKVVGPAAAKAIEKSAVFASKHPELVNNLLSFGAGVWAGDAIDKYMASKGIRVDEVEAYYDYLQELETSGINADTLQSMVDQVTGALGGDDKKNHPEWWASSGKRISVRDYAKIMQDIALSKVTHSSIGYDLTKAIDDSNLKDVITSEAKAAVAAYYKRIGILYTDQDVEDNVQAYFRVIENSIKLESLRLTWIRAQDEWGVRVNKTDDKYYPILRGMPKEVAEVANSYEIELTGNNGPNATSTTWTSSTTRVVGDRTAVDASDLYGPRVGYWEGMSNAVWNEKISKMMENTYLSPALREYLKYLFEGHYFMQEPNSEPIIITFFPKYSDFSVEKGLSSSDIKLATAQWIKAIQTDLDVYRPTAALLKFTEFTPIHEDPYKRDIAGKTYRLYSGDLDLRYALANAIYGFKLRYSHEDVDFDDGRAGTSVDNAYGEAWPIFSVKQDGVYNPFSGAVLVSAMDKVSYNEDYDPDPMNANVDMPYGKYLSLIKFRAPIAAQDTTSPMADVYAMLWLNNIYFNPRYKASGQKLFYASSYALPIRAIANERRYTSASIDSLPNVAVDVNFTNHYAVLEAEDAIDFFDNNRYILTSTTMGRKLTNGRPTGVNTLISNVREYRIYRTMAKTYIPFNYDETLAGQAPDTADVFDANLRYHMGNAFAHAMFGLDLYKDIAARWTAIESYYGIT